MKNDFFKSSFSGVKHNCVEVCINEDEVLVRHSKEKDVVINFSPDEWKAFIAGVKNNEFEL